MANLKIGDHVRRSAAFGKLILRGKTGVVSSDEDDVGNVKIRWDDPYLAEYNNKYWQGDYFDLIEPVAPAEPIGTSATRFTDTNGKKMVMISCREEDAEVLRTLLGARIQGHGQTDTHVLWDKLFKLFPAPPKYAFEALGREDAWKFKTYIPIKKLEINDG